MAAALRALLRSPEELKRRRANALKRAADFSWDKAALSDYIGISSRKPIIYVQNK